MRISDWSSDVCSSDLLAAEAVAKEEVEPGEGGMRGGTDILAKRDDRRQPHGAAGAVDFPLIFRDDIDTFQRSEEHTSELQSLMRISYAVFCLKKKQIKKQKITHIQRRI